MKRGRVTSAILATIAAGTLGITLSAASSASAAPSSAAKAASKTAATTTTAASKHNVVVINCQNKAQVEPRDFVLACADGNIALERLGWTSWTPKLASAFGTYVANDCIPNCAEGHFHSYPAIAVLWRPVRYGHSGGVRFSDLTVIFTGSRPQWLKGSHTLTSSLWPPL